MRRTFATVLLLACCACGGTPTTPSSASGVPVTGTADFAGLWTATFRYTDCSGERQCVHRIGTTQPFTLRLQQAIGHVHGVFTTWDYAVDVEGDVLKDGSLVLAGGAPAASDKDDSGALTITKVDARLDPAGRLTGTLAYEIRPRGYAADTHSLMSVAGTIDTSMRGDLSMAASTFDGTWRGRFVVRDCTPAGSSRFCYPYEAGELATLEISLSQDGVTATGTATIGSARIPVTATISGASIVIEGDVVMPASGGGNRWKIFNWHASKDVFGRMNGAFDYVSAWPADGQPREGATAHAELWQVVRVP